MSQNLTKPELKKAYDELLEKYSTIEEDYKIIKSSISDKEAATEAYKLENQKLKISNNAFKLQIKDSKSKLAAQINRSNQLAHRKKELEHELTIYRKTIDTYGSKCDKLVGIMKVYLNLIKDSTPVKYSFFYKLFNKKSYNRFRLINETCENAKTDVTRYI